MAGERVANDYADLWDGGLEARISTSEDGSTYGSEGVLVWSGVTFPGGPPDVLTLGNELEQVIAGRNDDLNWDTANYFDWFADALRDAVETHRLSGMSDILTINSPEPEPIPEPVSVITWTLLGIVGCVGIWRNRRRKGD